MYYLCGPFIWCELLADQIISSLLLSLCSLQILIATWKIIKSLLPPEAQKIIMFRTKRELLQEIDASNLPKWLGGEVGAQ